MATYQVNSVQAISDTVAHWTAWAQAFGAAFSSFGWSAQSGHDELVATGSGSSYAWSNTGSVLIVPGATLINPVQSYRVNGAWNGTVVSYTGANAANSATVCDLVTYATGGNTAITYVCISSIAANGANAAPPSDTTHWAPYPYEIWKSAGSNSSSNPLYVRIVYGSSGGTGPFIHLAIGSGIDSNGNITGGINTTSTAPLTNAKIYAATSGTASTGNMLFSGDADNFRFVTWQGLATAGYQWVCVVDRAKTASGTDSDAFTYVGLIEANGGTGTSMAGILPKTTLSSPINQSFSGWVGIVSNCGITSSMANFGATPAFPIFPALGYIANPCLGVMGFNNADVADGNIIPVWIYGQSHNYLVSSKNASTAANTLTDVASTIVPAIRFE